jgi:hypothetical protein
MSFSGHSSYARGSSVFETDEDVFWWRKEGSR